MQFDFFVQQTNITRFYDEGKIYWFKGLYKMEEIYGETIYIDRQKHFVEKISCIKIESNMIDK